MCGICGRFNFSDPERLASRGVLRRMCERMVHRGPDDEGYFTSGALGFGFRRLSIIDLAAGRQPMSDQSGMVTVVFNGEIYNFQELRAELEAHGHVFRTRSDTEVIVHGFKQWGVDVLDRLNGMFGLAIWDERNRRLLLARDRFGIKPLYYRIRKSTIEFSSEMRSLLAASEEPFEVDEVGLKLFLQHRFIPSPFTILKGVKKLAAGSRLIVEENGEPVVQQWWRMSPVPFERMPDEDEATECLEELYKRAVKRQLISDVPLGLLLSGGVDSALLLALMKEAGGTWHTYSVGYGSSFKEDELEDAARIANHFDVPNEAVRLDRQVFESTMSEVANRLEEPVTASSAVLMYYLCKRARQDVTVALMGQGPDEMFGGYNRHLGVAYGANWRAVPAPVRMTVAAAAAAVSRSEWIRRADCLNRSDRVERYQEILSICDAQRVNGLMRNGYSQNDPSIADAWRELIPLLQPADELGGLQFLELRSTLPDELLIYADKISMAHSLEVRVPYLDHEVVSYVERLNSTFKVRYGRRKWLHKKVAARHLPKEWLLRKKRGFASDVDGWLRASVDSEMNRTLSDTEALIYKWIEPTKVRGIVEEHRAGKRDNHKLLYSLVVLEHVLRSYTR